MTRVLLLMFCASQAAAQAPAESARALDREIDQLRERLGIPGLSLAVMENGSVLLSTGHGFADIARGIPAADSTPYEIASLSKPFASVLLMRLVEAGRLDLDAPMSRWVTAYESDAVKVRHVFSHTAHANPPGSAYQYNGNAFANLFDVVVGITGRRYRELMMAEIITPLGMTETSPGNDLRADQGAMAELLGAGPLSRAAAAVAALAQPYRLYTEGDIVPTTQNQFGISTSSGVVSSVRDLLRFDRALDADELLRAATRQTTWTAARTSDGRALTYGLGWFVQPAGGDTLIWHYGFLPNLYSALYLKIPSRRLTFIVLANSDALSAPFRLGAGDVRQSAFACAFLRHFARRAAGGCADASNDLAGAWLAARRSAARASRPVTGAVLERVAGDYEPRPGTTLRFAVEAGRLVRQGSTPLPLFAEGDSVFFAKAVDVTYTFTGDGERPGAVVIRRDGQTITARRIGP